ncbi:MAG TPA: PfkB family carbohydrate kinase [Marmoricola sp.]|nr:PfkB family carbohydrate kinase [Marmoricola sp.]
MTTAAVIGGVAWNLLVEVPHLPTDLTTIHATGHRAGIGGTGAGKALHLARLGITARLHALVGEDEAGDHVRRALEEAGVSLAAWPDPAGTERHLNLMEPNGDRVSIFLDHSSPDPDVSAEELEEMCRGAELVFVSLTHYSRRVLPLLSAAGRPVWVDLHDWNGEASDFHDPFVEHGTHLFVSDVRLDDPLATATRLARDKALVVVTHGSRGATAFFPDREPIFVPVYDAGPVVDTNGAGDAFSVGIAYGLAQGWDWGRSLQAGAVVAGGCVTAAELCDPTLTPAWLEQRL